MSSIDGRSSAAQSVNNRRKALRVRSRARRRAAATAVGVALVAIVAAPGALAAGQEHNRFHDVHTELVTDFCGTGQQIEIAFDVRVNEWFAPHKGDFKATATGKLIFTNPLTGDTVVQRFANAIWEVDVSGDPAGIHVVETTVKGLPELFKTPHGGVLTRDAGYIVLRTTFDGDEFISGETVVIKGPHPQAESDFELFCQILPAALGL